MIINNFRYLLHFTKIELQHQLLKLCAKMPQTFTFTKALQGTVYRLTVVKKNCKYAPTYSHHFSNEVRCQQFFWGRGRSILKGDDFWAGADLRFFREK
jgi:hypothetical protein